MTPTQPPQGVMAELRELLARATPGPWMQECAVSDSGGWKMPEQRVTIRSPLWTVAHYSTAFDEFPVEDENAANAALIVAAVNALPGLLDEADRLQARTDELYGEVAQTENRASALLARCEGLEAALREIAAAFTPRLAEALERWEDEGTAAFADPEYMDAAAIKPLATIATTALAATRTTGDGT